MALFQERQSLEILTFKFRDFPDSLGILLKTYTAKAYTNSLGNSGIKCSNVLTDTEQRCSNHQSVLPY